jgi:hypothetical protein
MNDFINFMNDFVNFMNIQNFMTIIKPIVFINFAMYLLALNL